MSGRRREPGRHGPRQRGRCFQTTRCVQNVQVPGDRLLATAEGAPLQREPPERARPARLDADQSGLGQKIRLQPVGALGRRRTLPATSSAPFQFGTHVRSAAHGLPGESVAPSVAVMEHVLGTFLTGRTKSDHSSISDRTSSSYLDD